MERTSALSTAEILGVATASAAALGGVIVALGRSQASTARERVAGVDVTPLTRSAAERAQRGRDFARSAAELLASSYPGMRDNAGELLQRAAETARPRASRIGGGASSTAEQAKATGARALERLQTDVLPVATAALGSLVDRADDARSRSQPSASDVRAVAVQRADRAVKSSTNATKESLATVGWTLAALTVVYFVLLSPERREQLRAFAWNVFDQAQVLVRDFQGYEDDF